MAESQPSSARDQHPASLDSGAVISGSNTINITGDFAAGDKVTSTQRNRIFLVELLVKSFDLSELRSLTFDLNVAFDVFSGDNKSQLCRDLVSYLERRDRLDELIGLLRQYRPNIAFPIEGQLEKK